MADLIAKVRIPEANVSPLADAIRASEPGEQDEEDRPLPETDDEAIHRSIINHLQAIEQRYRRRQLNAAVDETLVVREP
ncbi:hypothetical protein LCGC14_1422830 [marine sediment metagenome]|uniref:Uncharacterized protein n=1 Tax=marine sediment metagenome TaxID=412755 RepID=A0A0F9KBY3_9ZZZZ